MHVCPLTVCSPCLLYLLYLLYLLTILIVLTTLTVITVVAAHMNVVAHATLTVGVLVTDAVAESRRCRRAAAEIRSHHRALTRPYCTDMLYFPLIGSILARSLPHAHDLTLLPQQVSATVARRFGRRQRRARTASRPHSAHTHTAALTARSPLNHSPVRLLRHPGTP